MSELAYYQVAAKWWAAEARKANEDHGIGLPEELFKDFEEKLAIKIKKDVEYLINDYHEYNKSHPDNIREFDGISLDTNFGILVDTLRSSHIGCTRPALPTTKMLVSPTLVFFRDYESWEYKRFDDPCSVDTDRILFKD